jgi:hypothetical protein
MKNRALLLLVMSVSLMAGAATLLAAPEGGPKTARTQVDAYSTDRFNPITFRAGEEATVIVQGDGDTGLHLRVYDQGGHLVDDDTCRYDRCVATFTPIWTGPFTITVENLGSVYNEYSMLAE